MRAKPSEDAVNLDAPNKLDDSFKMQHFAKIDHFRSIEDPDMVSATATINANQAPQVPAPVNTQVQQETMMPLESE